MTTKGARVSWRDTYYYPTGRRFGTFQQWDGEFALIRYGAKIVRIAKEDLTFEGQG